ncbi:MAG: hypothetical protein QF437_28000 [Planctomycetota bacterium]|jgi:hypothetical protein|nr:hypothetical protein [Planctomycetota bacterium]MDP7134373.1 hypothetical protein [Planctomycetota bacterium]MDP7253819.1 hypothetical protein [Planctomycetota bacterium]
MKSTIKMKEVTEPEGPDEDGQSREDRFARNWSWFDSHAAEIYGNHRGKCVCIAGEELFVSADPREALAKACAAHPEDDGRFTRIIPKENLSRIYVDQG